MNHVFFTIWKKSNKCKTVLLWWLHESSIPFKIHISTFSILSEIRALEFVILVYPNFRPPSWPHPRRTFPKLYNQDKCYDLWVMTFPFVWLSRDRVKIREPSFGSVVNFRHIHTITTEGGTWNVSRCALVDLSRIDFLMPRGPVRDRAVLSSSKLSFGYPLKLKYLQTLPLRPHIDASTTCS